MREATFVVIVLTLASSFPLSSQTSAIHTDEDEYTGILRAECKKLGIPFPIPRAQLRSEGARAFAEQALEETFSRGYLYGDVKFGFRNGVLVLWYHPRPVQINYFGNNPESVQAALSARAQAPLVQRDAPFWIRQTIPHAFETPPELVTEVPPIDSRYALQALGGVNFQTAALTIPSLHGINVLATWSRILGKANRGDLEIDREPPLDTSNGRRTVETTEKEESDGEWRYRTHYRISMWDPAYGRPTGYGRELRISAELITTRQPIVGGDSTAIVRSGPAQQPLVDAFVGEITSLGQGDVSASSQREDPRPASDSRGRAKKRKRPRPPKKPGVDPFGPAPVKWSKPYDEWRPVALDTVFRWYDRFVSSFPRSVVLPHLEGLDETRFYTAAELKDLMDPRDWVQLVAGHLDKVLGLATRVVFVNGPATSPNSHDLLGQAAALSAAMQVPFELGTGFPSLANYRWYNQQRETLYKSFDVDCEENPKDAVCTLKQFINKQIAVIASTLPDPERSRVKDRRASFDTQLSQAEVVWASASLQTPEIKLSPMLVRTLFMQTVDGCAPIQWKYRFPLEGEYTAALGRSYLGSAEPSLIASCFDRFGEVLAYPLAHELAHVFLSENPKAALYGSEKCADVFAVNYMASSGGGLFEWADLLKVFDSNDGIAYFGFGQGQEDGKRLEQLRQLRNWIQSPEVSAAGKKVIPLEAARKCVLEEASGAGQ